MANRPSQRNLPHPPASVGTLQGRPDANYHPASRGEAARALKQKRRVYARESSDVGWGRVVMIEGLLDQGRRTPAWMIRFASGGVRAVLDGEFLVERETRLV